MLHLPLQHRQVAVPIVALATKSDSATSPNVAAATTMGHVAFATIKGTLQHHPMLALPQMALQRHQMLRLPRKVRCE